MVKCPINLQSCYLILDENSNNQDYYGVQIYLLYTKKSHLKVHTREGALL